MLCKNCTQQIVGYGLNFCSISCYHKFQKRNKKQVVNICQWCNLKYTSSKYGYQISKGTQGCGKQEME